MVMVMDEGAAGAAYVRAGRNRPRPKVLGPGPLGTLPGVGGDGEFQVSGPEASDQGQPGSTSRSGRKTSLLT
jgi:hypothetical protein